MAIDFPNAPITGQTFSAAGVTWIWDGTKWSPAGIGGAFLPVTGGTMSGAITLPGDPVSPLQAATKEYVDNQDTITNTGGFINKFRNPRFDVWQRGAGPFTTNNAYTADGWLMWPTGAAPTVQRASLATIPSPRNSLFGLQIMGVAGNTDIMVSSRIESYEAALLGAGNVTVQAAIYNNTGATITPKLRIDYADAQDNWTTATSPVPFTNLQPCPAGQWTIVAYTFQITQAQATLGVQAVFDFGPILASQWVVIAEADIRLTPGWPVGLCANPPTPEFRPVGVEQSFMQRYYQIVSISFGFYSTASLSTSVPMWLQQTMRIAPTVTMLSNTGNSGWTFSNSSTTARTVNLIGTVSATGYVAMNWTWGCSADL